MRTACIPSSTRSFRRLLAARRRKDVCKNASQVWSLDPISSILLLLLTLPLKSTAERSAKKDPTQYLLTVEQMIENDYPVPSYLADVFSKPDGWVETPEADPDADAKLGNRSVLAMDCEMARTPTCVFNIVY
jgi:hypothetical protein